MTSVDWVPQAATPGLAWPGLPPGPGVATLALQHQLDLTQWLPVASLEARQFEQLRRLAAFACRHVPHYRDLDARALLPAAAGLDARTFLEWPLLTKAQLQRQPEHHLADRMPREHGAIEWITTSGSTGTPLRAANSALGIRMQHALLLRSHLWFGLEPRGKFAIIRAVPPKPMHRDWGAPDALAFATGPAVSFSSFEDHAAQLDWVIREAPMHLLTLNANLRALIDLSLRTGRKPTGLRTVMGMSNIAAPDLPAMARDHWGSRYFQSYACSEMGSLALQCPLHEHLHVQSEHVLLEILRPDGSPCDTGEIGRVVVTDLHNFAMPLIRYDIGDQAAFGAPCPCGRGLPVLDVVAGRTGDLATDPTGRRFFAHLVQDFWIRISPIRQRQIVQVAADRLDIRYVADRDLTEAETTELSAAIRRAMRFDYRIECRRVPAIPPGPGGKFVDFVGLDRQAGNDGSSGTSS